MIFTSLLVPVVLWKYRSWKLFLFIMIPYILVAIPLCIYNYVRFDSIFEFGISYNLTAFNHIALNSQNPIGVALKVFVSFMSYLFNINQYSLYFPFVEYHRTSPWITYGSFFYRDAGSGIINFPIVFCLLYMFKNNFRKGRFESFHLLLTFLVIAIAIIMTNSVISGYIGRFMVDFTLFIILSSLFCTFYWCNDHRSVHLPKTRLKVTYVLLSISIFVGLLLFVIGLSNESFHASPHSPALYPYLEYSLGILRVG
jgi:hypothetical protein